MAEKILGCVVPQPKGAYDASYNYNILDTVQHGAAVYQSLKTDNQGHSVTDKNWWRVIYDLGEAIKSATDVNMPSTETPASIASIMAIGSDGQAYAIAPETLVRYVIEHLKDYDIIAVSKK